MSVQILKSASCDIAYEIRGEGPPLLLIMGLSARGAFWEDHILAYEKHFTCIVMDNRGAGDSAKPQGPYTSEMMADDSAALLKHLDLGPAHIAGISMGGIIAQSLALKHPALVKSLLLISTWSECSPYMVQVFENSIDP